VTLPKAALPALVLSSAGIARPAHSGQEQQWSIGPGVGVQWGP